MCKTAYSCIVTCTYCSIFHTKHKPICLPRLTMQMTSYINGGEGKPLFKKILKIRIYFTLWDRGREGKTEGEKHRVVVSCVLASNPGGRPDWEPNWPPFDLREDARPTEPHRSGRKTPSFEEKVNQNVERMMELENDHQATITMTSDAGKYHQ